jgi:hypothetical protein
MSRGKAAIVIAISMLILTSDARVLSAVHNDNSGTTTQTIQFGVQETARLLEVPSSGRSFTWFAPLREYSLGERANMAVFRLYFAFLRLARAVESARMAVISRFLPNSREYEKFPKLSIAA